MDTGPCGQSSGRGGKGQEPSVHPVLVIGSKSEIEELINFEKDEYKLMAMISLGVAEEDTPNSPPRKPLDEVVTFID